MTSVRGSALSEKDLVTFTLNPTTTRAATDVGSSKGFIVKMLRNTGYPYYVAKFEGPNYELESQLGRPLKLSHYARAEISSEKLDEKNENVETNSPHSDPIPVRHLKDDIFYSKAMLEKIYKKSSFAEHDFFKELFTEKLFETAVNSFKHKPVPLLPFTKTINFVVCKNRKTKEFEFRVHDTYRHAHLTLGDVSYAQGEVYFGDTIYLNDTSGGLNSRVSLVLDCDGNVIKEESNAAAVPNEEQFQKIRNGYLQALKMVGMPAGTKIGFYNGDTVILGENDSLPEQESKADLKEILIAAGTEVAEPVELPVEREQKADVKEVQPIAMDKEEARPVALSVEKEQKADAKEVQSVATDKEVAEQVKFTRHSQRIQSRNMDIFSHQSRMNRLKTGNNLTVITNNYSLEFTRPSPNRSPAAGKTTHSPGVTAVGMYSDRSKQVFPVVSLASRARLLPPIDISQKPLTVRRSKS